HRARRRLPDRGRLALGGADGARDRRGGLRSRRGGDPMNDTTNELELYRRQLNEWVAALAVADNESVTGTAAGYTAADIDLFTEGNLDKRADILDLQLTFVKDAFDDFDDLISEYMEE